jgi:hypothetical protein
MTMLLDGIRSRLGEGRLPPGPATWGGAKLLPGLNRPLSAFRPVLALTILSSTPDGPEILVGVRDPATNRTHQNVVSVPTRRVRTTVAKGWLRSARAGRGLTSAERGDLWEEIAHIFSLKLGLADAQERELVSFDVVDFAAFQGLSVIGEQPDGQPITESLTMFNTVVTLGCGRESVPPATASYRPLVWAGIGDFVEMTRLRDPGRLNAGLENAFFCAYGLCLQTSVSVLSGHFTTGV